MALFGLHENGSSAICLNSVSAALDMLMSLDSIDHYVKKYFEVKFEMGIGIHFGEMILGD